MRGGTARSSPERQNIVCQKEKANDDRLRNFDAIYSGQDVDAVRTENGNCSHIGVIKPTEIYHIAEIRLKLNRYDYIGDTIVDEIDHKHRNGSKSRDEDFVSPPNVE